MRRGRVETPGTPGSRSAVKWKWRCTIAFQPGSHWERPPKHCWRIQDSRFWWTWLDGHANVYWQCPNKHEDYWVGSAPQGVWPVVCEQSQLEMAMSFLKRNPPAAAGNGTGSGSALADLKESFPAVYEYLTATAYPDGEPRQTSTLLLVVDPDGLKGCLNDRQEARTLWVTADTVDGVIEALEAVLTSSRPTWRQSTYQGKNQGGKRR